MRRKKNQAKIRSIANLIARIGGALRSGPLGGALDLKKTLVGLLIEINCAGERIQCEGTAALVSFTAELPRRLLPGRCQDSGGLVAGEGTPY